MLLFIDGFDHYATADILKKWSTISAGSPQISPTTGRRGGGELLAPAGGGGGSATRISKTLTTNSSTLIAGFNYRTNNISASALSIIRFGEGSTLQLDLETAASGALQVLRGGSTVLGTTATGLIVPGVNNYIEMKVAFHSSAGAVTLKINGATVLSVNGVNTIMTANAYANSVILGTQNAGVANQLCAFDDFYVCNSLGSTNNDFLGDCRIDSLLPNADGFYSQFTPSTGSAHFDLVDEATPNTTDYNDGGVVGDRDSYAMTNLDALTSSTVYGVQVCAAVSKDDAGARSTAPFIRSGGTNSDGTSAALSTSQTYQIQLAETNPAGSVAWTESTVNAMEAGVRVAA